MSIQNPGHAGAPAWRMFSRLNRLQNSKRKKSGMYSIGIAKPLCYRNVSTLTPVVKLRWKTNTKHTRRASFSIRLPKPSGRTKHFPSVARSGIEPRTLCLGIKCLGTRWHQRLNVCVCIRVCMCVFSSCITVNPYTFVSVESVSARNVKVFSIFSWASN